ncbi:MAG TPA: type IV toxin-antitoxin system AbiEi family antitoxin domain-containing protein [Solirubrobacterales bacterium]|jgi:very-short-patch-repair endonuclease
MDAKGASADAVIAGIAGRQHGVVTRAQLEEAGVGRGAIAARVRRGSLHRLHQGVYAVGYLPTSRGGAYMAAVLACGEGAVLSHASAAALWGLLRPIAGPVHVSLPSLSGRRRRSGIVVHRTTLAPADLSRRADIPVTTPGRTIRDIRRTLAPNFVRKALREAQHRRYRLDPRLAADRTRSDLEDDFRAFVRRHRLPPPEVNVRVGRFTVDFLWRSQRLAVETDSYEYHHGEVAFEDDRERDLALRRRDLTVLRYTGRQLEREPVAVAAEIRARLAS